MCNSWFMLHDIPDLREVFHLKKEEPMTGWLGKPLSEARCLAAETPDVLHGAGNPINPSILTDTPDHPYLHVGPETTYANIRWTESGTLEILPTKKRSYLTRSVASLATVVSLIYKRGCRLPSVEVVIGSRQLFCLIQTAYLRSG